MIQAGEIKHDFKLKEPQWIKCPICSEEWTKLRPCQFVKDDHPMTTHVCVECAESGKSLRHFLEFFNIDAEMTYWLKSPYAFSPKEYTTCRSYIYRLENIKPIVSVEIESDGMRVRLRDLGAKKEIPFDNIFQCLSYFKKRIKEDGLVDKRKSDWNS